MASTSKSKIIIEEDYREEEFGHFDDFTLASSWERFISEIEAVCRQWLADGPKNLLENGAVCSDISSNIYKVKSDLKYALKNYIMEYYFEARVDGKDMDWISTLHDLQQSFGVKNFLVIAPQSASGVVLDAPEASKLLSAVAIALSNCSSLWPAFVPVHDPSRKAYIGIQSMCTIFTRRFEADRIGSHVPIKLMHLEGLYELFLSKFVFTAVDLSMHLFKVHFRMKLTYRTLPTATDDEMQGSDVDHVETDGTRELQTNNKIQWDDDCPWSEWYSAEDPLKGLELISVWQEKTIESSMDMAELENVTPLEADKWFITPSFSYNVGNSAVDTIGFASQLCLLVKALASAFEVQFMEDFVSVESSRSDTVKSSAVIPPPTVLDRVLKDLFHDVVETKGDFVECEHKNSRAIKGAPLQSLFSQFCLHALWFGSCNIRAIAVLWIEFVREVAWCWEELQPLPRLPVDGTLDLSTCLINQKLHMLAICIHKKRQHGKKTKDSIQEDDFDSPKAKAYSDTSLEVNKNYSGERDRRGSAGIVGMMLLNSRQLMHAPTTQDSPLMTEDMHEERLQAVEAFGSSNFSFSAQLEKEILSSDMSAFKAANPDAVFEDFIRWHSPRDWEDDNGREMGVSRSTFTDQDPLRDSVGKRGGEIRGSRANFEEILNREWPPRGKLSERMSDNGNSWRKIWIEASPLPANKQKPLLDPNREGEKVIHYLETLRPHQLLEQMVCTAFRAAADTLSHTTFGGDLTMMTAKIDQLYATIASSLRCLHGNSMSSQNDEVIEDLDRLCVIFGHVEKLLILSASLHRKFLQAPRLSEAIFSNFFKSYLPTMGISLLSNNNTDKKKEDSSMKLEIMTHERETIVNMFPPPTANQSWRKVLSMGNLLNGHEPIFREIIFSKRDHVSSSNYYAATNNNSGQGSNQQEIETYRMYICGTSNDLRLALAVTSCD